MNIRDWVGARGEYIFAVIITDWCDGRFWFDGNFLGAKHPVKDFIVDLVDPKASSHAMFFVQVKSTRSNYRGSGASRKLSIRISKRDVLRLQGMAGPAYVVGIDIGSKQGFIKAITPGMTTGFSGIPTVHVLDCPGLIALWHEVDVYWALPSNRVLNTRFK